MRCHRLLNCHPLVSCGLALGGLLLGGSVLAADQAQLKQEIAALLSAGWEAASDSSERIEGHYAAAKQLAPSEPRTLYAVFLARLKQRRYTEASQAIDEYLKAKPEDLTGWQARIWLDMLTKKYSAALVDMERLSKLLPPDETIGEAERPYADSAQFLGKMIGYLNGPLANALPSDTLQRSEQRITERLTTGRREQYGFGVRAVQSRFSELQLEHLDTKNEAVEQQNREKEQERIRLAAERSAVEGEKASLDDRAAEARKTAETAINNINTRRAPLDTQYAQLDSQAGSIRATLANLSAEIAQIRSIAASTKDPIQKAAYLAEADRVGFVLANQQTGLQRVEIEGARVSAAIAALENERNSTVAQYEAAMKQLGRRAETLQNTEKRISVESRQVNKPAKGVTGAVSALSSTATALTTYHPFPFEQEKTRLLESFK